MKSLLAAVALMAAFTLNSHAQSPDWVNDYGAGTNDEFRKVELLANDSILVMGSLDTGTITIGSTTITNSV
jgi:hypothetical protein